MLKEATNQSTETSQQEDTLQVSQKEALNGKLPAAERRLTLPPVDSANKISEEFPNATVVVNGDPAFGTVHYIRQIHDVPGSASYEDRQSVGEYQALIVNKLSALDVKHVFNEGLSKDRSIEFESSRAEMYRRMEIEDTFEQELPLDISKLNPQEKDTMAKHSGAKTYWALTEDVAMHATADPYSQSRRDSLGVEMAKLDSVYSAGQVDSTVYASEKTRMQADMERMVMDEREGYAAQRLQKFFQENPGEEVALVYGGAHVFNEQDFINDTIPGTENKLPLVLMHDRSQEERQNGAYASARITKESSPEMQMQLIEQGENLNCRVLPYIKTEKGKLLALEKINPEIFEAKNAESFREHIERLATPKGGEMSPAIRVKIDSLYATRSGPFKGMFPQERDWQSIQKAGLDEGSQLVSDEQDIRTQIEIIRQVPAIAYSSFEHIRSVRGQGEALSKMKIDPAKWSNDKQSLRINLRANAHHEIVAGFIDHLCEKGTGPFKDFE